jgi:predicted transcriptional regulator
MDKRGRRTMTDTPATDLELEDWQLREIRSAMAELDLGTGVGHETVAKWLDSWGTAGETNAPM